MREQIQVCPIPGCQKKVKRLLAHLKNSHPDIDPANLMPVDDKDSPKSAAATDDRSDHPQQAPPVQEMEKEKAPESVDYGQVIVQLMHVNDALMAQIAEQQQRLEEMAKSQTDFQESVIAEMNKVPDVARRVVTGTLDQIMAEAQAKAGDNGTAALVEGSTPAPAGHGRGAMMEQLLPLILQKLMGGGESSGQTDLVKQITSLQAIANAFNQPMLTGMQMATTMFTAAARAGLRPEEAAQGAQTLIDSITPKKQVGA